MKYRKDLIRRPKEKQVSYRQIDIDYMEDRLFNKVSTQTFTSLSLIPKTLLDLVQNLAFIWFLFLLSISLTQSVPYISVKVSIVLSLSFLIVYRLVQNALLAGKQHLHDEDLNSAPVAVFTGTDFTLISSEELREGDLILIKRGETCQADSLILAVDSEVNEAFVDKKKITGSEDYFKKRAVRETQSFVVYDGMNISELKERLEYVKIAHQNSDLNAVDGKVKIKGSPKVIVTTIENYLMAGSRIVQCGWVLGLVVNSGNDAKRWFGYDKNSVLKHSKLSNWVNICLFSTFALLTIYSVLTSILGIEYMGLDYKDTETDLILNTIVLYGSLVPITLFISVELMYFIKCKIINHKNKRLQIHNENVMMNLGKTEYIIMEKSGVLVKDSNIVQACMVDRTVYFDKKSESYLLGHMRDSLEQEDFSSSSRSLDRSPKDSYFENLKADLLDPMCSKEKYLLGVSLIICNTFMSNDSEECATTDDEALLSLGKTLGLRILSRTEQSIEIELGSKKFKFSIISYGEPKKITVFKALLKEYTTGETIMIFRGPLLQMSTILEDEEDLAFLEEHAQSHAFRSLRKIVFAYKLMTSDEVKSFMVDYKQVELTSVNKKQRILDVFESYAQNLKLLSLVGIDKCTPTSNIEAIQYLENCGIKLWICTKDDEESALATAYRYKLVDDDQPIIKLADFNTENEALSEIRTILNDEVYAFNDYKDPPAKTSRAEVNVDQIIQGKRGSIRKEFNYGIIKKKSSLHPMLLSLGYGMEPGKNNIKINVSMINFVLTIDGKTLDMALRTHELLKNLVVLLFASKMVLAYSMSPEQKKNLVKVVKEGFEFRPVVMAVGDKYGDEKMLLEATIGVKVSKKVKKSQLFSDISIKKLSVLPSLIVDTGTDYFMGYRNLIFLTIFKEVTVLTLLFLYQTLCSFSSCYLIDVDLLILFEYCLSLIFIVSISLTTKSPTIRKDPKIYCTNFIHEYGIAKKIVALIAYSLLNGILLFFFIIYGVSNITNKDGHTEDSQTTGLVAFILVNIALYIQGFCISDEKKKAGIVVCLNSVLLIIILALAANGVLAYDYLSSSSLAGHKTIWPLLCIFPLLLLSISGSFLYKMKSSVKEVTTRLMQYSMNIKKVFYDSSVFKYSKEEDDFDLNRHYLTFHQTYRENLYLAKRFQLSLKLFRIFLVAQMAIVVTNNILVGFGHKNLMDFKIFTVIPSVFYLALLVVSFLIDHSKFIYLNFLYLISVVVLSFAETFYNNSISTVGRYPVFLLIFGLILYSTWRACLVNSVLIFCTSLIVMVYEVYSQNNNDLALNIVVWILIMLCILILLLVTSYVQDLYRRQEYVLIQKAEIEVEKSSSILSYLLPEFVRKRVKDGVRYIAEDKGTVSVIFCDICDFDKIMDLYSPQELTFLIDDIFGRIDMICENLGVTKIETVGKTYLACTGLKDSESNIDRGILKVSHARRAVEMAFEIIKEAEKIQLKDGSLLSFKIGISSGPVTAGVVGFHKPQFSLVGDTVNTSSRMASTLTDPNSVQISINTFELLEDTRGLTFKDCKREVKGKGTMNTKVVTMSKQNIEEVVLDDLNSIFNRRRSSVLNLNSTPTLVASSSRLSDQPHLSPSFRGGRSSLLFNLDIKSGTELLEKRTTHRYKKFCQYLFRESEEEVQYRNDYSEVIQKFQKLGLICCGVCNGSLFVAEMIFVIIDYNHKSLFRMLILICGELGLLIGLLLIKKLKNKLKLSYYISTFYTSMFICFFIDSRLRSRDWILDYMYLNYNYFLLNFFTGTLFKRNLPFNLIAITLYLVEVFSYNINFPHLTYIISFMGLIQVLVYLNEKRLRLNRRIKVETEKELEKTKQLLTQMMPPHALSYLEEGKEVTERLTKVTLMFADIVGFTAWSSVRTPREVVGMLSELFTRFDKMCVKNNVYKVHTIGDCYVAMGFVDDKNRNPAKEAVNLINFARCLISLIEETNEKCNIQLGMRIGIHTGDIIGGITGTKIVRYDIYGEDVSIANKMESNGQAGNIAVSETTKEIIEAYMPDSYLFEEVKEVKLPSMSKKIKMYFLNKLQGDLEG